MHSNLMQPDRYLPALIIDTVKLEQQDVQVERLNAPRLNYLGAGDRINPKEQPALDGVRERGRTADMIDMSIQAAHKWACDQVVNKGYFDAVVSSVNAYLRQLKARGAILGGKCWVDPDFNTEADIAAGKVTFSYDFTAPYPAERVTFRSTITSDYVASIFSTAA